MFALLHAAAELFRMHLLAAPMLHLLLHLLQLMLHSTQGCLNLGLGLHVAQLCLQHDQHKHTNSTPQTHPQDSSPNTSTASSNRPESAYLGKAGNILKPLMLSLLGAADGDC